MQKLKVFGCVALLFTSFLVGCSEVTSLFESPSDAGTLSTAIPLWEEERPEGKEWTSHVLKELDLLGTDLITVMPLDYGIWCPKYQSISYHERKAFWAYLLSEMARFESGFDPSTSYTESFTDSSGQPVVSRGLLQLSIESANDYGCGFQTSADVHDPKQNLSCGIRILNRWMKNDQRIGSKVSGSWKGGARYWSVLRSTSSAYAKIIADTTVLSICR